MHATVLEAREALVSLDPESPAMLRIDAARLANEAVIDRELDPIRGTDDHSSASECSVPPSSASFDGLKLEFSQLSQDFSETKTATAQALAKMQAGNDATAQALSKMQAGNDEIKLLLMATLAARVPFALATSIARPVSSSQSQAATVRL
jgi:hypothetical protein